MDRPICHRWLCKYVLALAVLAVIGGVKTPAQSITPPRQSAPTILPPGPETGVIRIAPEGACQFPNGGTPFADGLRPYGNGGAEENLPFAPDPFRMSHAFPANSLGFDYGWSKNVDSGEADESEFGIELVWKLSHRTFFTFEAPLLVRDPVTESNTTGIGDIEVGLRWVAYAYTSKATVDARRYGASGTSGGFRRASGSAISPPAVDSYSRGGEGFSEDIEDFYLTLGLNIGIPTGDDDRGLGQGNTIVEPVMLIWYNLGGGRAFQSDVGLAVPVGGAQGVEEFIYNFALSQSLESTKDLRYFRWVTPIIGLNGVTEAAGDESGSTVVNLTPGVRWQVGEISGGPRSYAGVAYSFPLTGPREFDHQFIASFILDF